MPLIVFQQLHQKGIPVFVATLKGVEFAKGRMYQGSQLAKSMPRDVVRHAFSRGEYPLFNVEIRQMVVSSIRIKT